MKSKQYLHLHIHTLQTLYLFEKKNNNKPLNILIKTVMSRFHIFYTIVENGTVVIVEISSHLMNTESREKENMFLCTCLSISAPPVEQMKWFPQNHIASFYLLVAQISFIDFIITVRLSNFEYQNILLYSIQIWLTYILDTRII